MGRSGSRRLRLLAGSILVAASALLGAGAGHAPLARASDSVSISMLAYGNEQPGLAVLIPNFERVYPNISVDVTYAATTPTLYELETTELASGSAPDLLTTYPGCGEPVSVCELAPAGDLAPLVKEPWATRSLPLVTSLSKYGEGLYAFEPEVSP